MTFNKIEPKGLKKDLFRIIYYIYNKKSHYTKAYLKSKKYNAPKDQ